MTDTLPPPKAALIGWNADGSLAAVSMINPDVEGMTSEDAWEFMEEDTYDKVQRVTPEEAAAIMKAKWSLEGEVDD